MAQYNFQAHIIDQDLPAKLFAQTVLADLDNDGRPEFIMGEQYGAIYWYKCHTPDRWSRHALGTDSPCDVGDWILSPSRGGHSRITPWAVRCLCYT